LGFASIIGDVSGLIYGFYINKHWTYSTQKKEGEKYFFKYFLLYTSTIFLNWILLKFFLWFLINYNILNESLNHNITENVAKIMATAITTLINFVGTNYVIFSHNDEHA
jgi:putative flippase GtrA